MIISELAEILEYNITAGGSYQDSRYVNGNAWVLIFKSKYGSVDVLFNTVTQEVYQVCIDDHASKDKSYKWYGPGAVKETQQVDASYCILEDETDMQEKAYAIFRGEEFDKRIVIPLDMPDDVLLKLAMEAHKRDITLNKYFEEIIENACAFVNESKPQDVNDVTGEQL